MTNTADGQADAIDFNAPAALTSNVGDEDTVLMTVQNVPTDRHSLVHSSTKTYKNTTGGAKNPETTSHRGDHHLTVENAHLLLIAELAENTTTAYVDKTTMEKPDIESQLSARGLNPIDNLNFYRAPSVSKDMSVRYNDLESKYVRGHAKHFTAAIVDFIS